MQSCTGNTALPDQRYAPVRCEPLPVLTLGIMMPAGRLLLQSGVPPPGGCICPLVFAPVCAADPATKMNITFENACQASVADCCIADLV